MHSGKKPDPLTADYNTWGKSIIQIDCLQFAIEIIDGKKNLQWIENELNGAIDSYKLFDAYPNPFNSSTIIGYQIPKSGLVTLKIYDVVGKEIMTLINEVKPVGSYTVSLEANDLTSGIYFYKLQSGKFIESKKMILLK